MQFLFVIIIIISLNLDKISTQTKNVPKVAKTDKTEVIDTPSPEWIKYQKERYQDSDKLPAPIYKETSNNAKDSIAKVAKVDSKMEITSRNEGSHPEEWEETDYSESEYSEDVKKDIPTFGNSVEFPSIQGFIRFIKSLKQTWMKSSIFRIDDKIKMLHQLKDSLLKTIERQFKTLWQDDDEDDEIENYDYSKEGSRNMAGETGRSLVRQKRGILDESSINFPPGAAIMSINFLTFAVFLIKLVLQVVNIIKTKHYQFTSMNMGSTVIRNG